MHTLIHLIVIWLVTALALWIVAKIVDGITVRNFTDALIATAVIAILDYTVGPILTWIFRALAWPLTFLTLGLFIWVIRLVVNALILILASMLSPGFRVRGFVNAMIGSLVLTILTIVLSWLVW